MASTAPVIDRVVAGVLPAVPRAVVARASSAYIAGATLREAVAAVERLNARGRCATLDVLGEEIRSDAEADAIAAEYRRALDAIAGGSLDANLSVKPTAFGLELDEQRYRGRVAQLAAAAAPHGLLVRLDMEDSSTTDATLRLYRALRAAGVANVGPVLQAALRRTPADVEALAGPDLDVRLCKGIYLEPAAIAHQDPEEIRRAFSRCLERLLAAGSRVGIATHDERLVDEAVELVRRTGVPGDRYEFQMLLGVRPELGDGLVRDGHRLRIYVPYGERWYEYSLRRLRENPRVAGHVLRALARDPGSLLRPAREASERKS